MSTSSNSPTTEIKGFVCEYKKRSAWFGSFEIRYIVISEERLKIYKNEKQYHKSKSSKPSITVVLRNARLKIMSEQRHPHVLSIQVRGTEYCLSFVNNEQLKDCESSILKVIQHANLIRPTLAQKHQMTQSNVDEKTVNNKYRTVLTNLGLPTSKIEELISTQSFVSKMEIISQNQSNNAISQSTQDKNGDVMHWIRLLRKPKSITISNISDIATLLYEEANEWMISFVNEQGLTLLTNLIPHILDDTKCQIEVLQCFKAILDKQSTNLDKIGLQYIVNDGTCIQGIIDLFDSQTAQVSILIIKLLSVICWHSPDGFTKVIDSLEIFAQNVGNSSMWIPIVMDLKPMIAEISNNQNYDSGNGRDQFAFEYVLYTLGLINSILNSFDKMEDRVDYRNDLEQLGFGKIVSYLLDLVCSMEEALMNQYEQYEDDEDSDYFIDDPWLDKMNEHLDLYEAVKLKDLRDSSLDGIDVSNPLDLFEFINSNSSKDGFVNEWIHILQCLTTIPRQAVYLWSTIEKIMSYSTAGIRRNRLEQSEDTKEEFASEILDLTATPQLAFPSFDQLKNLLSRYDEDMAQMEVESSHYNEQIGLLQTQIENLKHHLSKASETNQYLAEENVKLKQTLVDADTIAVDKDFFNSVINKPKRQKHEKRRSSLMEKIGSFSLFGGAQKTINPILDNEDSDGDDDNHSIDVMNAWGMMNGDNSNNKSPQPLHISSTEATPPAVKTQQTPTRKPMLYKIRTPPLNSQNTQGLPSPVVLDVVVDNDNDDDDDVKNAEAEDVKIQNAEEEKDEIPTAIVLKKYLKMLKMKIPQVAVENAMRKDQIDANILINYLENGGSINPTQEIKDDDEKNAVEPPKELAKYLKMHKMKIPIKTIKNKMKMDGVDGQLLDDWLNGNVQKNEEKKERIPPKELEKYIKMHKMKIPMTAIKNKMKQNGVDHQLLLDWLDGGNDISAAEKSKSKKPKEPPENLKKWLKMHKMKIPLTSIKNKMKQNGVDPQLLIDWLNNSSDSTKSTKSEPPPPELSKYMKMHKMKIPIRTIKNKMKQNGDSKLIPILDIHLNISSTTTQDAKKKIVKEPTQKKEDPNALPIGMKPKKVIKPKNKMKMLHWNTVRPKEIKDTIWDGMDESDIKIDINSFESLFKQKQINKATSSSSNKSKNRSSKSEKNQEEIHLVDGKKSYNVNIGLSRYKMSHQQIKDAILKLDESALNLDQVTKLRAFIPDASEQEMLRNFVGDVTLLANCERFYLALSNINDLSVRMELWQFQLQFDELLITQQQRINILQKSHDNVYQSESFKIVLKYVLAFGNYMNGGSRKGGAFGFEINSLKHVLSAKSIDNKSTLMHYIYVQMEDHHPNALEFVNEFEILSQGSRLDVTMLTTDVSKMNGSLNRIKKKIKQNVVDKNDLFTAKMSDFLKNAQPKFDQLKKEHDRAKTDCTKLAQYFNCKKDVKYEYFKDLYEFSVQFKKVGMSIKEDREREAKKIKNAQIKAARLEQRMKNKHKRNLSKTNGTDKNAKKHRRTSSATKIYKRNSLSKKRGSVSKKIGNSVPADPEMFAMLERQQSNPNNLQRKVSYAQRRASRHNRKNNVRKESNNMFKRPKYSNNAMIERSQTVKMNGGISKNGNDKQSTFGLPPPPPQLDDVGLNEDETNVGLPRLLSPTESIVSDVTIDEIERRRTSSQARRSKAKPKKQKKWFF